MKLDDVCLRCEHLHDEAHAFALSAATKEDEIERLTAEVKSQTQRYQFMSDQVDAKCEIIEQLTAEDKRLRLVVDSLLRVKCRQQMYEPIDSVEGWHEVDQALASFGTDSGNQPIVTEYRDGTVEVDYPVDGRQKSSAPDQGVESQSDAPNREGKAEGRSIEVTDHHEVLNAGGRAGQGVSGNSRQKEQ